MEKRQNQLRKKGILVPSPEFPALRLLKAYVCLSLSWVFLKFYSKLTPPSEKPLKRVMLAFTHVKFDFARRLAKQFVYRKESITTGVSCKRTYKSTCRIRIYVPLSICSCIINQRILQSSPCRQRALKPRKTPINSTGLRTKDFRYMMRLRKF